MTECFHLFYWLINNLIGCVSFLRKKKDNNNWYVLIFIISNKEFLFLTCLVQFVGLFVYFVSRITARFSWNMVEVWHSPNKKPIKIWAWSESQNDKLFWTLTELISCLLVPMSLVFQWATQSFFLKTLSYLYLFRGLFYWEERSHWAAGCSLAYRPTSHPLWSVLGVEIQAYYPKPDIQQDIHGPQRCTLLTLLIPWLLIKAFFSFEVAFSPKCFHYSNLGKRM